MTNSRHVANYPNEMVSVKKFGAIGDGTTDDTAALQNAINAAGSGTLFFESGKRYKITSPLILSTSGIKIEGNNSTLDGSAQPASTTLTDKFALKVQGSIGNAVSITADVVVGASKLSVSSTTGLTAGDIILVYSAEKWPDGATGSTSFKGALHKIRSVDSGTALTLMDGTFFSYATASGANIKRITPVSDVTINSLKVIMGGLNKAHSGIRLQYTENVSLMNCETTQTEDTGVFADYCFGGNIIGGSFTYCNSPADGSSGVTGNTGYGICPATATRDFIINGASFDGCRHAVAGGGTYPAIAARIKNCVVRGGRSSTYATSYQMECHEDCVFWVFDSNTVNGVNSTNGATGGGIMVRGQNTTVTNNTITNSHQYGILLQNFDASGSTSTGAIVKGNTITNPRLDGIVILGSASTPWSNVTIADNSISVINGEGVVVYGSTEVDVSNNNIKILSGSNKSGVRLVGTSASFGNRVSNATISGNIISNPTLNGIRADYADTLVISGNVVLGAFSEVISLTNCTKAAINGNRLQTSSQTRSAVYLNACVSVTVNGCSGENISVASSVSSGVYILGASTDISVTGNNWHAFNRGIYSVSPANYITVTGNNSRTSITSSVDVSASANTSVYGNL